MTDVGATAADHGSTDVRPVVRTASAAKWGQWAFGGVLLLLAALLFQALDGRRRAVVAPSTVVPGGSAGSTNARIVSPPPLALPSGYGDPMPDYNGQAAYRVRRSPAAFDQNPYRLTPSQTSPRNTVQRSSPNPASPQPTTPDLQPPPTPIFSPPVRPPNASTPRPGTPPPPSSTGQADGKPAGPTAERVRASRLTAPDFTVTQGTVIPAVLETALDSTRPGFARALVSRDVKSFDGTRVLIPRGSRLFGEYDATLEQGQNRALIRWARLTRPDGVRMELDSPSADALGRAGIRGKVDSKFLQRFGGAILQSVLDLGVGLATRPVRDRGVIVALAGSNQVVNQTQQQQVKPTLRIQQGSRVTVFVARDLDFSDVER